MSEFSERALRRIGRLALQRARRAIPSRTLRKASRFVQSEQQTGRGLGLGRFSGVSASRGKVTIPHYWAVIVHDGRKQVNAKPGRFLVWFRNPAQDPRFPGRSTPERLSNRRRLTRAEFRQWLQKNARIKDKSKRPMIVAKSSGPVDGDPFFGNEPGEGMFGLHAEATGVVEQMMRQELKKFIGEMSAADKRVATATARL